MCLVENAQHTKKYLNTYKSGFALIKPCVNCFVHRYCFVFENQIVFSKSLFKILEKFFEYLETRNSNLETRLSILEDRNSKLKPRNSILDSRKLRGSRIEFQVETVNLPLSGTVTAGDQHHIPLKAGATPVKQPLPRVTFAFQESVKVDLKYILEDGVIERSTSEWACPLVIVRRPSGDLRIRVDYRKLNEATRVTSYPLSNMTETLNRLTDAKFFTSIDMVSGYHQIGVAPEDWHKTAFVSPFGLFQYCRLPFGLVGAPGMFQAVIKDMLQVLDTKDVMAHLNDVICFDSGFEEHLKGIGRLSQTISKAGFKLSGKKCHSKSQNLMIISGHKINDRPSRFIVSFNFDNK